MWPPPTSKHVELHTLLLIMKIEPLPEKCIWEIKFPSQDHICRNQMLNMKQRFFSSLYIIYCDPNKQLFCHFVGTIFFNKNSLHINQNCQSLATIFMSQTIDMPNVDFLFCTFTFRNETRMYKKNHKSPNVYKV